MKLTDFKYEIEGLNIPDAPLKERDSAKLMVLNRAEQTIEHRSFSDIHEYLNEGFTDNQALAQDLRNQLIFEQLVFLAQIFLHKRLVVPFLI